MKNIGIKVKLPEAKKDLAKDEHDPFTGNIKIRGRTFTGIVVSAKMTRTATISWSRTQYDQKYERYIKKWTKIHAHNPEIINAQKGDVVKVAETRPISKTKNFVIVEIIGKDIESRIKEESRELDSKTKEAKEERRRKRKESQEAQQTLHREDTTDTQEDGSGSVEEQKPAEEPPAEEPVAEQEEENKES